VFYNAILFRFHLVFSRKIESEVSCGVFCSNKSTFVTDDLAQCLCGVSLVIRCAFDVNLDVGTSHQPTTHGFNGVPVRSAARRFFLQGVPGAQPSYPSLWRAQEGALTSSWRSAARRFNLKGVPGAQPSYPSLWRAREAALPSIMEIGRSSILFKMCTRGTAFLPKIMESPRGSSALIMEIGC